MRLSSSLYLLTTHYFASLVLAAKCAAPPLPLSYRNSSIAPGILTQGIPVLIGTPHQYVALTPSLMLDHTFIPRYTNSCVVLSPSNTTTKPGNNDIRRRSVPLYQRDAHLEIAGHWKADDDKGGYMRCAGIYGGGYSPESSESWEENQTSIRDAEDFLRESAFTDWAFMKETFVFADFLELYTGAMDSPPEKRNLSSSFILPKEGAVFGGLGSSAFGLTPNSMLLSDLHNAGMIPSKSWSLTNSTLCLGCIDENAHAGAFQTFKPADRKANDKLPCLIQAKVEKLFWYPKDGLEGTFLIKEGFSACIDPGVRFLALPDAVRTGFEKATGRDIKDEFDDQVVLKGPPGGDPGRLNFRLEGGLVVNVTVPGAGNVDSDDGEWKIPIGKGGWGAYGTGVWTLGKPFTDRVVLRWDSEAEEYAMANINEDPDKKEVLKAWGCEDFPDKKELASRTASIGAIVGSLLGGFLGGIGFACACLWFFKRGKKGIQSKYTPMPSEEALPLGPIAADRRPVSSLVPDRASVYSAYSSNRPVSPIMEPQLVADNAIYEVPEGGRSELSIPSAYPR